MFENRADLTKQLSLTACYGLCLPLYDIQSRIIMQQFTEWVTQIRFFY